jgi:two-component system, sensor histidine kinase and response regulator
MYRTYLVILLCLITSIGLCNVPDSAALSSIHQLKEISKEATQLINQEAYSRAWRQMIKPGLSLLRQLPDTTLAGREFRLILARYYNRQHQSLSAIHTCTTLIRLCQQMHDHVLEDEARYILTLAYADLGMYQECITMSLENLTEFLKTNNYTRIASTYNVLAWASEKRGDLAQFKKYSVLGIHYSRKINIPKMQALALMSEAELYTKENKYQQAIQIYQKLLPRLKNIPELFNQIPGCYQNLTDIYHKANEYDNALQTAKEGLTQCWRQKNIPSEAYIYSIIANVYAAQGNHKAALLAASRALPLCYRGGMATVRQEVLKNYGEAQERVGNTAAALKATRQLAALTDSLNEINKAEAIATAEIRFDVKAKNETIGLLNKNAALKQQQNQQQQQIAGLVVAFLIIVIGVVGFSLFRENRNSKLLQAQKTEIEGQAAQLTKLNGIKDQLFSIVSHDLRGPVMNLRQGIDQLETTSPATLPDALPRFRQSVNALANLTDNMLCWALSQMDGLRTRPQPFALTEIVQEVLALYQETIHQKNLHVVFGPETDTPLILADENHAEIALRNIIQNAIKFSPNNGSLVFGIEPEDKFVTLLITDNGPGFDWQPGHASSGQTTTRASQNSTGLGLTVVEDLMQRNGGSLQISRRADGVSGTVARLTWVVA